jgi:DNA primase
MGAHWIDFKLVREQVRMTDLLRHYRIDVKVRNDQATALCPFPCHPTRTDGRKRTPSLSVSLSRNVFRCFGCGASGNCIDFVLYMEGLDRHEPGHARQAALKLVEWFGLSTDHNGEDRTGVHAPHPRRGSRRSSAVRDRGVSPSVPPTIRDRYAQRVRSSSARDANLPVTINAPLPFRLEKLDPTHPYLRERGFDSGTVDRFGLGYCCRGLLAGRIAIPLQNPAGELVGYAGRIVDDDAIGKDCPKYLFPGTCVRDGVQHEFHKSLLLYNAHRLNGPVDHLVVVEGFTSVWWLTQCGFENVVALMGSSCSREQGGLISDLVADGGRITLLPDGDDAGARCAVSLFEHISHPHYLRWVRLSGGNQPTDFPPSELSVLLA